MAIFLTSADRRAWWDSARGVGCFRFLALAGAVGTFTFGPSLVLNAALGRLNPDVTGTLLVRLASFPVIGAAVGFAVWHFCERDLRQWAALASQSELLTHERAAALRNRRTQIWQILRLGLVGAVSALSANIGLALASHLSAQ